MRILGKSANARRKAKQEFAEEKFAVPALQPELVIVNDDDGLQHFLSEKRAFLNAVYSDSDGLRRCHPF